MCVDMFYKLRNIKFIIKIWAPSNRIAIRSGEERAIHCKQLAHNPGIEAKCMKELVKPRVPYPPVAVLLRYTLQVTFVLLQRLAQARHRLA